MEDYTNTVFDNLFETDSIINTDYLSVHDGLSPSEEMNLYEAGILPPYDPSLNDNLLHQAIDPVGRYVIQNMGYGPLGRPEPELIHNLVVPDNFSQTDIQGVCNAICDTLHWNHLPVTVTTAVPNAAFHPGFFTHRTFDDHLYLNPEYAHECVDQLGSTEIIISDMAHEIGHSMATKLCGNMGTYMDEKMADFISGYANAKMGVDIDVARRWFEWHYDHEGLGGYPNSEDRWDAEAAGYYFAHLTNADDLQVALKDSNFLEIIKAYKHDRAELVNDMAYYKENASIETNSNYGSDLLDHIRRYSQRYHLGSQIARFARTVFSKI